VTTGTSSATQNVTITNTGNANVTVSQINLSGAGYSMTGGGAPVTLTPSQNLILTVQFSPTTAGAASGSISIVEQRKRFTCSGLPVGDGCCPGPAFGGAGLEREYFNSVRVQRLPQHG
jgi:hypothetical protein